MNLIGDSDIDLFIFETGEGHVVCSKDLDKALANYSAPTSRLVAVGYDFTQEARSTIDSLGGLLFAERNFGWSDDRWLAVNQTRRKTL